MKKIMIIAVVLLAASCAKEAQTAYQTISFRLGDVQSGEMTKVSADAVLEAISATTPSSSPDVLLTLKSTTNPARVYSVSSAGSITVPVDKYTVTGNYVTEIKATGYQARYYSEPSFNVSSEVDVVSGVTEYVIPVTYTCAALVIDYTTTKGYEHRNASNADVALGCLTRVGDVGIAYFTCTYEWTSRSPYRITAKPVDEAGHEAKTYSLTTVSSSDGVLIESGKWYCFGPSEVDKESGSFVFSMPGWEAGQ